jgi:plasmid maintenance system antidote protein VapI
LKKVSQEDIKKIDGYRRLLLELMSRYKISQRTIIKTTGINKSTISKCVNGAMVIGPIIWENLQPQYGSKFDSIQEILNIEAEKARKKAAKEEEKKREGSEYMSNAVQEEMKEWRAEQDQINSELRAGLSTLRTEVESLKEQLKARDAQSGIERIPSSDFLKDRDLLDENAIDKYDLPRKKGKRKPKGE